MTTPQDTEAEKRIRAMAAIRSLLKVRFQRQPLLAVAQARQSTASIVCGAWDT
jgi:hypothetical protein